MLFLLLKLNRRKEELTLKKEYYTIAQNQSFVQNKVGQNICFLKTASISLFLALLHI